MKRFINNVRLPAAALLAGLLASCGGGGSGGGGSGTSTDLVYRVEVTNLTNAQPLSPVVVIMHKTGYASPFDIGTSASLELERLAEGGQTNPLVQAANADGNVLEVKTITGNIAPGTTKSVDFVVLGRDRSGLRVSLASMLTNTNDGFAGVDRLGIAGLAVGQEAELTLDAMDAGTEANTETAATVPGQGGTGFDATRDDPTAVITLHPGVVGADDGLTGSGLTQANRFDNPVAQVTIRRLQ